MEAQKQTASQTLNAIQHAERVLKNHLQIESIYDIQIPQLELKFEDVYELKSLLGEGAFGVVLEVQNLISNEISALKVYNQQIKVIQIISQKNQQVFDTMRNELIVLQDLQHPNIIRFKQVTYIFQNELLQILYSSDYVFIEMEKMNDGSLEQLIDSLYEKGQEILDEEYEAKIADFGLSAEYKFNVFSGQENIDEKMGTILYMAPEQALGQRYGKRIDMWACGVIMYKVLTGEHPFYKNGDDEKSYINRIAHQELKTKVQLSEQAESLFWRLCSKSLQERYSVHQAIKHPWITRNPFDVAPLTQGEELKLIEIESILRRAQQAMLFLGIQKVNQIGSYHPSPSCEISESYKKRIEQANEGFYLNRSFQNYSPKSSQCTNGGEKDLSDNDAYLDRINYKNDQSSYRQSLKEISSERLSIMNGIQVIKQKNNSRHRPPAIVISKKNINMEPKSAQKVKGDNVISNIDPMHRTMFQNNPHTEESQELSPLTFLNGLNEIKQQKRSTLQQEKDQSKGTSFNQESPMFPQKMHQFTPSINKRANHSGKGSLDNINQRTNTSSNSGLNSNCINTDINKIKKLDLKTSNKKIVKNRPNKIPMSQLQIQPQHKSEGQEPDKQGSQQSNQGVINLIKMSNQHQDSKFKPSRPIQKIKPGQISSNILGEVNVEQKQNRISLLSKKDSSSNMFIPIEADDYSYCKSIIDSHPSKILPTVDNSNISSCENRNILGQSEFQKLNHQHLGQQYQQQVLPQNDVFFSQAIQKPNKRVLLNNKKKLSVANSEDFSISKAVFIENLGNFQSRQDRTSEPQLPIISPSQGRLQKPFIIQQRKQVKNKFPNSPQMASQREGLQVNTQYQSKASLAEQLMNQINLIGSTAVTGLNSYSSQPNYHQGLADSKPIAGINGKRFKNSNRVIINCGGQGELNVGNPNSVTNTPGQNHKKSQ
ncbi:protein kinase domain containing protein [Stylonychia lemnae]|uniref:Protein kinase domain containing protein n=1 Tax=Stylonychia lemnae TaxID=5949 RepID=A0A078ADE3_STYLE|nr:protein kinase domain containing protein [Stylonychia lemnae]|eukprot:CDW80264.1 protein kinase domain containing protein [Stylonychia lemnae]